MFLFGNLECIMKLLGLLLFLALTLQCFSDAEDEHRKAKAAFMRYMKSAHPLPEEVRKPTNENVLFSNKATLPNFLNINATMDEAESDPNKMQNESSIAVNPKNPKNLIASAVDYRAQSSTWVYVSSDGGLNWKNLNLGKPYPEWRSTNDPSVYFDNEGIGYLCYGGFGDVLSSDAGLVGENGVFIAKTTDEGKTWKAHIPVIIHLGTQTMDSTFEDKYYVQVDNSQASPFYRNVYVPWKRVTPRDSATQIVLSKSVDFGETWSKPVNISHRVSGSSEDTTFGQSFPLASTGPDGQVYIIWNHGIEHGIGFSKSLDGGASFTEPRIIQRYNIFGETKMLAGQGYRHVVKGTVRAEAYPVIITDITNGANRGNLYLSWSADNYPNVYFSKSIDEGQSWSSPVIVHSDTTNDQFWHWMSIDPLTGDLAIMYLDSRNDTNNIMIDCYVSYSSNGGDTWIDKRVSDINSDIRLNPFANRAFAGDYSGNAFYDGIIYPSWVDMRNAVTNISDSDILTAVVNTRAPAPPDNFVSNFEPLNPLELDLSWIPPTKRAFDQPLNPADFVHKLVRDNVVIATLDGSTDKFSDKNITAFEKYEYEIYAVAGRDSSITRKISAYPGGSKQPDIPLITFSKGYLDRQVELKIKLPSFRSDKITPLANLQKLMLFRSEVLAQESTLNPQDTGKTISIFDTPDEIGFYSYNAKVNDYFQALDIETESNFSPEVVLYTGNYPESLFENFDNPKLPKYYISGRWKATDEIAVSSSNSLSNAPYSKYNMEQFDTLVFIPVAMPEGEDLYMTFMQICSLYPDDTASIEISYDNLQTWEPLANYNRDMFGPWLDNDLNENDWRFERHTIPYRDNSEGVFVRLRFGSNRIRQADGWYIDDVVIGTKAVTVNNDVYANNVKIFPNPVRDNLKLVSSLNGITGIKIFDLNGILCLDYKAANSTEVSLNLTDFSAGAYFVEVLSDSGRLLRKMIIINK